MKKGIYLLILGFCFSCKTTKSVVVKDKKNTILVGEIDKRDLQKTPYKEWFEKKYNETKIEKETLSKIENYSKEVIIKGFIGTWCKDSKRETPILYKILDQVNFDYKNLELIAVDKKKKAKGLEKGFNIIRVPTFIFYKKK